VALTETYAVAITRTVVPADILTALDDLMTVGAAPFLEGIVEFAVTTA
jgi:hypothetical protein